MKKNMNSLDQVIEAQLVNLSSAEIAGAYRALCGMMLTLTAISYRRRRVWCKDEVRGRQAAREWIDGRHGVISFTEACEELNLDTDRAREALKSTSVSQDTKPKNRVEVQANG